ncbi:MAG: HAD family phosphatase [Pseudomonadota bacterium]
MAIEAVVFDIGNVLIEWRPERFYDAQIGKARRRALFDSVPLTAMNLEVDRGAPMAESVADLAAAHPDWADEIRLWHSHWLEMASPAIPGSVKLLEAVKETGIPVYALTNFGAQTFETARAAYPFFDTFDRAFVSAHLGVLKPEPEIYAVVERETGHAPETLLFTDDSPKNVAGAEARGWHAHLFDGPDGWAARLVADGVLQTAPTA